MITITALKWAPPFAQGKVRDLRVAGDAFSVADLLMTTVLRILDRTALLMPHPGLVALKARCESRPAFARALEGQMSDFRAHGPADMKKRSRGLTVRARVAGDVLPVRNRARIPQMRSVPCRRPSAVVIHDLRRYSGTSQSRSGAPSGNCSR